MYKDKKSMDKTISKYLFLRKMTAWGVGAVFVLAFLLIQDRMIILKTLSVSLLPFSLIAFIAARMYSKFSPKIRTSLKVNYIPHDPIDHHPCPAFAYGLFINGLIAYLAWFVVP